MVLLFLLFLLTHHATEAASNSDPDLPEHCLRAHNDYRNRHKSVKLVWSMDLAEEAQKWANHLAEIDQMERDTKTKDGENIFYMYGGDPSEACDRAVENWYSEVRNYDFKDPKESPSTDHFSQIVWKSTKELGVGTAQSKSGNFFLVARYRPSGISGGSFRDNVEIARDAEITSSRPNEGLSAPKPEPVHPPSFSAKITTGSHFAPPAQIFESEIANDVTTNTTLANANASAAPTPPVGADMVNLPPKYGKDYQVEIRFTTIVFTEKMRYPQSREYHDVKLAITSAILQLYEDFEEFQEVQLLALRNGSVIATLGLIFSKPGHNYLDRLTAQIAAGKLGGLDVATDYVAADLLPDGYLTLTLPVQQRQGACPQPCSNPSKCYPDGCQISCCSYDTPAPPTDPFTVPMPPPVPMAPQPPVAPAVPPPPECPSTCQAGCLPQCDENCCNDKEMEKNDEELTSASPFVPAAPMPQPTSPLTAIPIQGYTCPQSTCPTSCYPECTPQCCHAAAVPAVPSAETTCPNQCGQVCGLDCPQDCCDKRSRVRPHHFGKPYLPPLNHAMANKAYMYKAKYASLRHPTKVSHHPHVPLKPAHIPKPYVNENRYASYWQPYLKLAKSYFGAKRGSSRNKVQSPQRNARAYRHSYNPNPNAQAQAQAQPYYGKYQKSNYYGNSRGMRIVKDIKSKGAPVNVRYAYRYGNRLLVPIDLPKGMEFKEMKGRKFISVPAFKKNKIPGKKVQ